MAEKIIHLENGHLNFMQFLKEGRACRRIGWKTIC